MPRLSVASRLAAQRLPQQLRSQSTQTPSGKDNVKEALKRNDDLQRDWDARLLTYEQMKPKTQSPTPVSELCRLVVIRVLTRVPRRMRTS